MSAGYGPQPPHGALPVEWKKWPSGEFAARELYDLKTDPGEDVNLADGPAARALRDQLAARLHRGWRAEHRRL